MAINEQASRDATSKAPVLVYSVNQGGWPASSTTAPPPPPRLAAAALMPQPPPPPLTAERGESRHRAVAAAVAFAATAAAPAAWAGCAVRCGTTVCIGVAKRIKMACPSVVPASPPRRAWAVVGGVQAGLWGPPKRLESAEAPAPSADGLEARAGKPPAVLVVSKGCKPGASPLFQEVR